MSDSSRNEILSRDARVVWQATLAQAGSIFPQLVYLSALRDAQTAQYAHHGLSGRFGEDLAAQVMLESHRQVFSQWLRLPLSQQLAELRSYLDSLGEKPLAVVENWLSVRFYRSWMPVFTPEHEQQHYLMNIETLLTVIRNEYLRDAARRAS